MNNRETKMLKVLKRFGILFGVGTAILSGYFSWDGLDQTITGANPNYTELTSLIGVVMIMVITLLQFVFNTDYSTLSPTLKLLGGLSYIYSIYTNKLGLSHLFGFSDTTSWMIAVFMDVVPEALIAWGLDESLRGDFLGNLLKLAKDWVLGEEISPVKAIRPPDNAPGHPRPDFQFHPKKNKGGGQERRKELTRIFHNVGDSPDDTKPKIHRGGFE